MAANKVTQVIDLTSDCESEENVVVGDKRDWTPFDGLPKPSIPKKSRYVDEEAVDEDDEDDEMSSISEHSSDREFVHYDMCQCEDCCVPETDLVPSDEDESEDESVDESEEDSDERLYDCYFTKAECRCPRCVYVRNMIYGDAIAEALEDDGEERNWQLPGMRVAARVPKNK